MNRKQPGSSSELPLSTDFSNFKDLPIEIRLAIWKLVIPDGRVIRLDIDWDLDYARTLEMLSIPSILHVYRKSREVGTRISQLGFGASPTDYVQDWFNPAADTLYIPPWAPPGDWPMGVPFGLIGTSDKRTELSVSFLIDHFQMWHSTGDLIL